MLPVPALRHSSTSEHADEQHAASGERPAAVPVDAGLPTRASERFQLPREALPSVPPPVSPDAELNKATTRMTVPESVRLLRTALPTPSAFHPVSGIVAASRPTANPPSPAESLVVVPASAPVPRFDRDTSNAPVSIDDARRRSRRSTKRAKDNELGSAIALFALLACCSLLITLGIAALLFR